MIPASALAAFDLRNLINDLARTPLSKITIFVVALTVLRLLTLPLLRGPAHKRGAGFRAGKLISEACDALIYAAVFIFMVIRPFVLQAFVIPSGSMWSTLHVGDYIVANKAIYRYTEPKVGDIVVFRPPVDALMGNKTMMDAEGGVNVDYIKRCVGAPGDVVELRDGILFRNGVKVVEEFTHLSDCADTAPSMDGNCQTFRDFSASEKAALPMASFKLVKKDGKIVPFNYTKADANSPDPDRLVVGAVRPPYFVAPRYQLPFGQDRAGDPIASELLKQKPQPIPAGHFLMFGDNRNNSFDSRGWGLVPRDAIVGRSEVIWLPFARMGRTR